jgi:AraC-like DNA-binding protein
MRYTILYPQQKRKDRVSPFWITSYLQSQLLGNRFKDELIVKATKPIRHDNGNINMERLSHELSLSQKQFTRRFKIYTGFNP